MPRYSVLFTLLFGAWQGNIQAIEKNVQIQISIIIDDLGDNLEQGRASLDIPGDLTYAILPGTPFSQKLARHAVKLNKELMLHQPMQAINGKRLGPGGIDLHMSRMEVMRTVERNLRSLPNIRGINNHMGSLLTQHPGHMEWLMQLLNRHPDLYFIDSRTTDDSIAQRIASEYEVPNRRRNIFLDHDRNPKQIQAQFSRLIELARSQGSAIAIGHTYPETTRVLIESLDLLDKQKIKVVRVSKLIQSSQQEPKLWHASLSPSPQDLKSLKQ